MWAKCQRFSHSHVIKIPDLLKEKQKEVLGRKPLRAKLKVKVI